MRRLGARLAVAAALPAFAASAWQLSLAVRLWLGRVRYPFDVEWLEGPALYHAYRLISGLATYGPPRNGYIASNRPLYPVILAALGKVVGLDYPMARTFSFLCWLGAAALVASALLRQFGGSLRGFVLVALVVGYSAATTSVCEGVLDLVRDDALGLFLVTACAALVPSARKLKDARCVWIALTLTAVVYTRYPAVFPAAWVVAFVFFRHRSSGLRVAVLATAFGGVVLVGLLFVSHGWFWFLTIALMQDHKVRPDRLVWGIRIVLAFAPFLPALPLVALVLAVVRRLSAASVLWLGMFFASLPASLLPWAKVGGFENDLVPLVFLGGPAAAFLLGDLVLAFRAAPRLSGWPCWAVETTLSLAGAGFLATRPWNPDPWIPTEVMRRGAAHVNAVVASLPGGVISPRHPFIPVRNGHRNLGFAEMAYLDMTWSGYTDLSLGEYVEECGARFALVSGEETPWVAREIAARFQLDSMIGDAPHTLIGDSSAMKYVLRSSDDERGGHVVFDFESLAGWTGNLGAFAVVDPRPGWQQPIEAAVGRHLVDSYTPAGRDPSTGNLVSPPFVVDRPRMSLRVGGGNRPSTRVELRVEGRPLRSAVSIWKEQETLTRIVWDVSEFQGKSAQLALVDEDTGSWGHLTCDHVVLY